MVNECYHDYEVKLDALMSVSFVCKECGMTKNLRRKYACIVYLIGLIGWIPSFFYFSLKEHWLGVLLTAATYGAVNYIICYLFYKWLAKRNQAQLKRFIGD